MIYFLFILRYFIIASKFAMVSMVVPDFVIIFTKILLFFNIFIIELR